MDGWKSTQWQRPNWNIFYSDFCTYWVYIHYKHYIVTHRSLTHSLTRPVNVCVFPCMGDTLTHRVWMFVVFIQKKMRRKTAFLFDIVQKRLVFSLRYRYRYHSGLYSTNIHRKLLIVFVSMFISICLYFFQVHSFVGFDDYNNNKIGRHENRHVAEFFFFYSHVWLCLYVCALWTYV